MGRRQISGIGGDRGSRLRSSASLTRALTAVAMFLLLLVVPRGALGQDAGAVLVLGARWSDFAWTVNSRGAGFVVDLDEDSGVAYILTAKHVVDASTRFYVLSGPTPFSFEYIDELEAGRVPGAVGSALADMGYPQPTAARRGSTGDGGPDAAEGLPDLQTESWILSGGGSNYAVLPHAGRLELYHLLVADVVETDPILDVGLLAVHRFPRCEGDPVLYMDTPSSIAVGTAVTTFGCRHGEKEGLSRAKARGVAVGSEPGLLSYESELVSTGFSGGPVLVGEYVVAMNVTRGSETPTRINARLARDFKDVVDNWIGLRRMEVDLLIDSPDGARDGIVSTNQKFTISASARVDQEGQLLAPIATVQLDLPFSYQVLDGIEGTLAAGQEKTWTILSPEVATDAAAIRLHGKDSSTRDELILLEEIRVSTENGILVTGSMTKGPRNGDHLIRGDDFPVTVEFTQEGQADFHVQGEVRVEVSSVEFGVDGGLDSQSLTLERPIEWGLKPLDASTRASISFSVHFEGPDRNGKLIETELPPAVVVRIKEGWGIRSYWGIGRLSLEGSSGGSDQPEELGWTPERESRGELELGTKLRVSNVARSGIPLYVTVAGGLGVDESWEKKDDANQEPTTLLIADWRIWWGLGMSAELGPIEVCADAGYIWFCRYVDVGATDEFGVRYAKERIGSAFIRPGIELALAPSLSIYAGGRAILDYDDVEYYLQLRLRQGT